VVIFSHLAALPVRQLIAVVHVALSESLVFSAAFSSMNTHVSASGSVPLNVGMGRPGALAGVPLRRRRRRRARSDELSRSESDESDEESESEGEGEGEGERRLRCFLPFFLSFFLSPLPGLSLGGFFCRGGGGGECPRFSSSEDDELPSLSSGGPPPAARGEGKIADWCLVSLGDRRLECWEKVTDPLRLLLPGLAIADGGLRGEGDAFLGSSSSDDEGMRLLLLVRDRVGDFAGGPFGDSGLSWRSSDVEGEGIVDFAMASLSDFIRCFVNLISERIRAAAASEAAARSFSRSSVNSCSASSNVSCRAALREAECETTCCS